ncbi:MAG: GNAT family N-acetyltransferase, partial [Chloroflexota bacterium]
MTIVISSKQPIAAGQVVALLRQTDWARERNVVDVAQSMMFNTLNVGAWEVDGEPEDFADPDRRELIAYARVMTDWHYKAYLDDVVVAESYRGQGVGQALVGYIVDKLKDVEEIVLNCSDELVPFYAKAGFRPSGDN